MTKFLNISVDSTLGGTSPSDEVVASQKAVQAYVDAKVGGSGTTLSTATVALRAAGWLSDRSQTVTVSGITASSIVWVAPAPANSTQYANAGIVCTTQSANSLTFTCTTTPSDLIYVNVIYANGGGSEIPAEPIDPYQIDVWWGNQGDRVLMVRSLTIEGLGTWTEDDGGGAFSSVPDSVSSLSDTGAVAQTFAGYLPTDEEGNDLITELPQQFYWSFGLIDYDDWSNGVTEVTETVSGTYVHSVNNGRIDILLNIS